MVLYFSGTGNSLAIARQVAAHLNDSLKSLYEAVDENLEGEQRIGLVFPTYWLDAPLAVKALIPKLRLPKNVYTFIIITCGAQTNNAVWTVRRLLRQKGVEVDYCHKIRMPDSSALAFGRNPNTQLWKLNRFANRLNTILKDVADQKYCLHFSGFDPLGWLLNKRFIAKKAYQLTMPMVNKERCIGCGICTRLCPQANIDMSDKTAQIGDDCTMCLGCVHFCPHQAVEIAGKPIAESFQYHHPSIQIKDMFRR